MDTETTNTGKIKRKMVYTGPFYRWAMTEETLKKNRILYLILNVAAWVIFIGSMLFYSNLSRIIYIILPYACLMLVLFFFSAAAYNLLFAKQPMNREIKEKTYDRIKGASLVGMIFSGGSFAGEAVGSLLVLNAVKTEDILFIIATVLLFFIFNIGFVNAGKLIVTEEVNPAAQEWKDR